VSRPFRFISALGAVLFASVCLYACGGVPGNAVLTVNGNAVTKATFNHWMGVAASTTAASTATGPAPKPVIPEPPKYTACIAHLQATTPKPAKGASAPTPAQLKSECEQQYKSLQQEVLGFLISSEWVLGEANVLGVKISDKEVKKRFESIRTEQFPKSSEFERFLASSGQTISDLLLRVKLNLLSAKIQQKVVKAKTTVTQAQIEKYYAANPERYGVPEKRNLEIILTKGLTEAAAAKKEVESGKSFASVAKAKSIDPTTKDKGGVLTGVVKGEEQKALDTAIFSTSPHVLTGPIKTVFGYYVFEVTGTVAGTKQTLAQAKSSIKQQLTATQQQGALSKFVKEFKKKWTAKTDCRSGYVVIDCKQYKAAKSTSTTTTK
jgi:foldase protein PrsA